ncbi:MAG TPA: cysteine synthase family protein [Candidatus Saccharimonadaceae bacterium]|jgi:cysteine synthase B|nr:cysteine synthase family protein [Candidatus Saccharimonadaceae bacterium]
MTGSDLLKRVHTPDLVERIGRTPLIPVRGLAGVPDGVDVLGKAEWFNPGGSVKDRAAWAMVADAERRGALRGRTLLDATSGNTGIAYAWIGAARGHRVHLCLPANANAERRRLLAALGATLTLTDAMDGTDGAIREARRLVAEQPERWCYPDQYANPENWRAHYRTTAEEIWSDTEGQVTHVVMGIGTSGTLVGTGRRLRELNPAIRVIGVQPDSPYHALEGLKHLPTAIVPPIYDAGVHHELMEVASEEAIDVVKRQAARGLLLGWSAGAALVAAARVARGLERGVIVAILPDGAERYLSEPLWGEP